MDDVSFPYRSMARNNAWANATLYGALEALAEGAFTAPGPGFFPSLAATMNHIYQVDLYYIDALEAGGRGRSVYDAPVLTDVDALRAAQTEAEQRLIRFCDTLKPETLSEMRMTERPGGDVSERVVDLLLHLFQHQVHHRGQAHVQLQEAGVSPPQLDDFHLEFGRVPSAEAFRP